jgi:spore maturation protein CgeB
LPDIPPEKILNLSGEIISLKKEEIEIPNVETVSIDDLNKDIEEKNKIKSFIEYKKQKSIDIVFAGTFLNDIEKPWHDNLAYPSKLLDEVFELFMYDDYLSIQEAFKIVFDRNKILFSSIGKIQLSNLYRVVQNYIRSYSRILLIKKLSESGLNITICGNGWENFAKEHKNINYIGALDIKENLELIKKAKVLINVTPTLRNGSHERVFTGMLNNTVLFSDRSRYYDEFFEDEKNILYYSFNSLNDDIKKLKEILKDDKKLFDISQSAYKIVVKNHTWENRVDTMLEMVNLSKLMDK